MARFENTIQTDEEALQALAADETKQREFDEALRAAVQNFFMDKMNYTPLVIGALTDALITVELESHHA